MAVEEHPEFIWPEDRNVTVRRYLDFPKYLSLLESGALFFCRLDKLGDPFEGSWTRQSADNESAFLAEIYRWANKSEEEVALLVKREAANRERFRHGIRKWSAVNCWHLGEYESTAMWSGYGPSGYGVAIQSSFDRLRASFDNAATTVYAGKVVYIDHAKDEIPGGNLYTPLMRKGKSYEHEAELRALVSEWAMRETDKYVDFEKSVWEIGVEVEADLNALVETIVISPAAPSWFSKLVTDVTDRYGFQWDVRPSLLNADPLY